MRKLTVTILLFSGLVSLKNTCEISQFSKLNIMQLILANFEQFFTFFRLRNHMMNFIN